VTVTNQATGFARTTKTNAEGQYTVPELDPGLYTVKVSKAGFKEIVQKDLELHVGDNRELRTELAPGQTTESVTVEANAILVETQKSEASNTVVGQQVRELPLNGRNFIQLTTLMPGVAPVDGFDAKPKGLEGGVQMGVSGGGGNNNLWSVDGANNNDVGSNNTILVYPSIDAIAEFKILRNNYGPEYGQASGATINLVTKGGGNQFHGSGYYFGRNDALNAWQFTAAQNKPTLCPNPDLALNTQCNKPKLRRNDYGYTIGGPIVKDRAFFFWSQEWNHEIRAHVRTAVAPTAAMKTGDFSALLPCSAGGGALQAPIDPLTGAQFPGGIIPAGRLSAAGSVFIQAYNNANANLSDPCLINKTYNFFADPSALEPWREENIRGDININKSNTLMVRYIQDSWSNPWQSSFGWGASPHDMTNVGANWEQPGKSAVAKLTTTIGTNSVNDFQFSWSANKITETLGGANPGIVPQIQQAIPQAVPGKTIANLPPPTFWGAGVAEAIWLQTPFFNRQDLYVWKDDYSKIVGTHTLKAGVLYSSNAKDEQNQNGNEMGEFSGPFGVLGAPLGAPASTGDGFADLILRNQQFFWDEAPTRLLKDIRWHDFEIYAGDTWRATRNLTINYGFRWSFLRQPVFASNKLSIFNASAFSPSLADDPCNGVLLPKDNPNACKAAGFLGGKAFSNNALIDQNNHAIAPRLGFAWDVTGKQKTVLRGGIGQFFQRDRLYNDDFGGTDPPFNSFVTSPGPGVRTLDAVPAGVVGSRGASNRAFSTSSNLMNTWQWNLTAEQELFKNTKLEVAYVGNRGIHLLSKEDINAIPPSQRAAALTQSAPGVFPATKNYRPFGQLIDAPILEVGHSGDSIYHGLETSFVTRFHKSSMFTASYTWAKTISNIRQGFVGNGDAFADHFNHRRSRGLSDYNRPQIFAASLVYGLPELKDANPILRGVLGGWETTSIINVASGASLTVFQSLTTGGGAGGTGAGDPSLERANRVFGQPCHIDRGKDGLHWLNPAAFTTMPFTAGASFAPITAAVPGVPNTGIGACSGPPIQNVDFGVSKNWHLPVITSEGLGLQFRMEFFNAFNHPQFSNVNNTFLTDPTGKALPSFGAAVPAPNANREIQYSLKLTF
jgi:hypothetical protein